MTGAFGQRQNPLAIEPEKPEVEDPRELAIRRRELERRRTGTGDLRITPAQPAPTSSGPSLAIPSVR